jgi:tryptophan synthase alpha chain
MSRIEEVIAALKQQGKKGLIPFITAGDPDLKVTYELLVELGHSGATLIELGVPFSDPMADGPVIQRASERALRHGFGLDAVLATAAKARNRIDTPIVLFSYYNPLLQFGLEKLVRESKRSGIDGVLVTDLTPEEAGPLSALLRENDIDMIFLVAPTSTDARLRMITENASGFIYAVSRTGVTGQRDELSAMAKKLVQRVRQFSDLPVAVGFGISTREQVAETLSYADAAVVGSAIVAEIERCADSKEIVNEVGEFVRGLMSSKW